MDADVLRDYEFDATFAPKTLEVKYILLLRHHHLIITTPY